MLARAFRPGGTLSKPCVFLEINRYFYPSTCSTTRVRADSTTLEIFVLESQNYATSKP